MTTEPADGAVRIVDLAPTRVAVLAHRGDPALIGETIRRFVAWRKAAGLPPRVSATYNILYGDPDTTPPAAFRLDLCAAIRGEVPPNDDGVVAGTIPGGRCALLRHVGPEAGLGATLAWLCGRWLPDSGERRRDAPLFFRRVLFHPEVPAAEAVTDLHLPLEAPQNA